MNYVKLLQKDTGLDKVSEIRTVIIEDHDDWRASGEVRDSQHSTSSYRGS